VLNVSPHGIWILIQDHEYLLPYEQYPWFRDAKVGQIYNVELQHGGHLHWPELDVDLELESLKSPEKYPLVYKK